MSIEVRRFVRANVSAIVATGLEWVLITALVAVGAHYLVATAIGAIVGATTDFSIKRHWAFSRQSVDAMHREAVRYVVASASSLGLNMLVAYLLVDRLRMPAVPGVIAASFVVGVVWNYPMHRYFVFPEGGSNRATASVA